MCCGKYFLKLILVLRDFPILIQICHAELVEALTLHCSPTNVIPNAMRNLFFIFYFSFLPLQKRNKKRGLLLAFFDLLFRCSWICDFIGIFQQAENHLTNSASLLSATPESRSLASVILDEKDGIIRKILVWYCDSWVIFWGRFWC